MNVIIHVVEFGILEEACKKANRHATCLLRAEISVNQQYTVMLFEIPIDFDHIPFLAASNSLNWLIIELDFWLFNWLSEPNEENIVNL